MSRKNRSNDEPHVCKPSCHNPCLLEDEKPAKPTKRESLTTEYLAVRYTQDEFLELAEQLARATQSLTDAEEQKKAIDADHKDTVTQLELSIKRLSRKLTQRSEHRNVQCKWLLEDPSLKEKTLVRLDTGEIVRIVPMQDHDYQDELPITAVPTNGSEQLVLEPPPDGKTASAAND